MMSLFFYLRNIFYWRILLIVTFSASIGINLLTMIYWILLKNFSNPMWFMEIFVVSYSLVGIILLNKKMAGK